MPIDTIAPRYMQVGRIRLGEQTPTHPKALTTPRITSADKQGLEDLRTVYGGEVKEWDAPGDDRYELITRSERIGVQIVLRQWSQDFEQWSGGGIQRRCNGFDCVVEGRQVVPCLCPDDPEERMELAGKGEACKPTTRVNVLLDEWFGTFGVFRLETHSFYAAQELKALLEPLDAMFGVRLVPATLRVAQRTIKRHGQTKKFIVPVLDIETQTIQKLLQASTNAALASAETPGLGPAADADSATASAPGAAAGSLAPPRNPLGQANGGGDPKPESEPTSSPAPVAATTTAAPPVVPLEPQAGRIPPEQSEAGTNQPAVEVRQAFEQALDRYFGTKAKAKQAYLKTLGDISAFDTDTLSQKTAELEGRLT